MFIPDPNFFPSQIQIFSIPDPHQKIILTQKIVSKLSEMWSGLFIPDPDPDFYPSRIPGSGIKKRHRIPDPQHGFLSSWKLLAIRVESWSAMQCYGSTNPPDGIRFVLEHNGELLQAAEAAVRGGGGWEGAASGALWAAGGRGGPCSHPQAGLPIKKNPPKKTHLKKTTKMGFLFFYFYFFYENNTNFSLWNRFFMSK